MNNEQLFQLALNIEAPWLVTKTEFRNPEGKRSMHITLEYQSGFFTWPTGHSAVHDRVDRTWRHMNFFEHECYLHCKVPRVYDQDGKVKQVEVPWARTGSGFTLLFEAFSMFLIEQEMPVNKVGETISDTPSGYGPFSITGYQWLTARRTTQALVPWGSMRPVRRRGTTI